MEASDSERPTATTLLLLIDSDRNRELLADRLSAEFAIETADDEPLNDPAFDLCLLDPLSLSRFHDDLQEVKSSAEPVFLPFLLLTGERSPEELSSDVWDVVDEVIQRPVNPTELDTRIGNLLRRRRLSVDLARQKAQSEERFESLFQSTPDPVVVTTPDGTITEANDAFARTFGIDSEELRNRPITEIDLSPPDAVERVLLRIADNEPSSTTVQWNLDEDTSLVTELNTDIVAGLSEATERIGIFRDITARAEREKDLKRQNERLEGFADTIAHDLRNPLNVAQGRLDLAQQTGDEEHFEAIRSAQDRMGQMIDELLTLAKQGQAVSDPDSFVFVDAITRAWSHVETSDATIAVDVDESVMITADEGRLCELLENLFRNAVEHGGETVTVRIGVLSEGAGFYVEDDGPGIPPEKRTEVFEAGYTESATGTGFGLSIVQQIVDGHNWTITLTESDNGGARFELRDVEM
ncbi:ATP-binding protein [Halorubrum sp. DTA98]|uniref:ATP-binding protein n=1 Tax=Halorubrum sp. DTA98 TaxID=3402163 RepID=UPI003AB0950D